MAQLGIQQLRILLNPGNFFRVQKSENMAQSPEQQQWTGVYQDSKVLCKVIQSLKNLYNTRFIQMKTFKMVINTFRGNYWCHFLSETRPFVIVLCFPYLGMYKTTKYWVYKGKYKRNTVLILFLLSFLGILSVCQNILHDERK